MNAADVKQKLLLGQMSEDELSELLKGPGKKRGSFLKTILSGFIKGYTEPQLLKTILDAVLLFSLMAGLIVLTALKLPLLRYYWQVF